MKHPLYSEHHHKHYLYQIPVMTEEEYRQRVIHSNNISEYTRKQINQHLEAEKRSERLKDFVIFHKNASTSSIVDQSKSEIIC